MSDDDDEKNGDNGFGYKTTFAGLGAAALLIIIMFATSGQV